MRFLWIPLAFVAMMAIAIFPSCADSPPSVRPRNDSAAAPKKSRLVMLYIRTSSPGGIKQLRAMHIDIIRVRPDPDRQGGKDALTGGFIVEAVAPRGILNKLEALGFEVSETPPK